MKQVVLLLALVFSVSNLVAQSDLESLLMKQSPNCENVAFNSAQLINMYFDKSEMDSIDLVINKWENFCGLSEPLFRVKTLLNITLNTFNNEAQSGRNQQFSMALNYCDRISMAQEDNYHQIFEYYKVSFGYIPLNSDFDLTTVAWANNLLENNNDLQPVEKAYCLLYANQTDEFWEYMKSSELQSTTLAEKYKEEVERVDKMWQGNVSFLSGVFVPSSNLNEIFGTKAIFGLQVGAKVKKTQYDLTISFRAGDARKYYETEYYNQLIQTKHHFGGYIGLDLAHELFNNDKTELDFEWGIGGDFIDVVPDEDGSYYTTDDSKTLASLNVNAGLGYRFYLKSMNYIGLHAKYNYVDFNNKRGTDLSGQYVSVTISYHLFGNPARRKALEKMKLK